MNDPFRFFKESFEKIEGREDRLIRLHREEQIRKRRVQLLYMGIILLTIALFGSVGIVIINQLFNPKASTASRLSDLSNQLQTASTTITEIIGEIEETKKIVSELEAQKDLYTQLVNTDKSQVEAIALLLNQQQKENEAKAFWINTSVSFLMNLLTAAIAMYAEYRWKWLQRWLKKEQPEETP